MSLYSSSLKWLQSVDRDTVLSNGLSFMAAHSGCIATPVLSTATSGLISPEAGLGTAILFSTTSVLIADTVIKAIKVDDCARCVVARLDLFKRYAKPLLMAACIGTATHFAHEISGHRDHFTENTETICGPNGPVEVQTHIPTYTPEE